MDISVIICTYNRAKSLQRCLTSLTQLTPIDNTRHEILLIDNASTDNTPELVNRYQSELPGIKYVYEATPGKSSALNRGIAESSGRLLIFCDDDIRVASDWTLQFWKTSTDYKHQYWLGGRVRPDWQLTPRPQWFLEESSQLFAGNLGIHDHGETVQAYSAAQQFPIGASMAIPREIINTTGNFRTDLGPRQNHRGTSEDTDYLERAQKLGYQGVYTGTSLAHHYVDPARLSLTGFYQYGYMKGINAARYDGGASKGTLGTIMNQGLRGIGQLILGQRGNLRICVLNIGFQRGLSAKQG